MEEEMRASVTEANVQETAVPEAKEADAVRQEAVVSAATEADQAAAPEAEEAAAAAAVPEETAPADAVAQEEAPSEAAAAAESGKAEEPAESMADYEAEIDASLRRYERGEKVKCTVVSVDMDKIMVELGATTGIIRKQDVSDDPAFNMQENIKAGDEVVNT